MTNSNNLNNIKHFTPLKEFPQAYYWKDFDETVNYLLDFLLNCELEKCFIEHFKILSSVKKNLNCSTFSYDEIDFYTLGKIFGVYRNCIPVISEFFSLIINNILNDTIKTKMIVADSSFAYLPSYEDDYINIYFGNDYGLAQAVKPIIENLEKNFEIYFFKKNFSLLKKNKTFVVYWDYYSADDLTQLFLTLFWYLNSFLNCSIGEFYKRRCLFKNVRGKKSIFYSPACIESALSILNKLAKVNKILDLGQKEYNQFISLNSAVTSNGLNFAI